MAGTSVTYRLWDQNDQAFRWDVELVDLYGRWPNQSKGEDFARYGLIRDYGVQKTARFAIPLVGWDSNEALEEAEADLDPYWE